MQGLQFDVPKGNPRDPDVTYVTEAFRRNARILGTVGGLIAALYYILGRNREQ